jgi:cephalosporin hydroxylase
MKIVEKSLKILREGGIEAFVKKALLYVHVKLARNFKGFIVSFGWILSPFIMKKFRSSACNVYEIYDALNFAFSFQAFGVSIKPKQIKYEIDELLKIVAELKPKVILEIGTGRGGTLFLFTRVADQMAKIISIDLPGWPLGGGYPRWKIPLYKSFAKERQKIYLIKRDSHNPQTLEEVKKILSGEKVDFLFIDGDHAYEGVKRDFEMYSPLVSKGGIIAFHDILLIPPEKVGGVPKFWNEIK